MQPYGADVDAGAVAWVHPYGWVCGCHRVTRVVRVTRVGRTAYKRRRREVEWWRRWWMHHGTSYVMRKLITPGEGVVENSA